MSFDLTAIGMIAGAYLVATFVASALLVRFLPDLRWSHRLRKNMALFALTPLVGILAILKAPLVFIGFFGSLCARLFETISGRPQYDRFSALNYGIDDKARPRHTGRHSNGPRRRAKNRRSGVRRARG